jgi:dolichyl-phosphate beta-glucosyltransferase
MEAAEQELSIVIPAFNESRHLGATLDAALAYLAERACGGEVIVVDDGSTDSTADVVRAYEAACGGTRDEDEDARAGGCVHSTLDTRHSSPAACVRLLCNCSNRGKGYSVRRGVLEARGNVVLFSDADESTPLTEASKLLAALGPGGADVAIGSRELPGSDLARPQPWRRRAMGWVFRQLVRLIVVGGFRDTQCGFKAFRREAAREVFRRQTLDGFAFDVELLLLARRLGYRVVEVPVRWLDSPHSSVRLGRDGLRMVCDLFRIRFRAWRGAYR